MHFQQNQKLSNFQLGLITFSAVLAAVVGREAIKDTPLGKISRYPAIQVLHRELESPLRNASFQRQNLNDVNQK